MKTLQDYDRLYIRKTGDAPNAPPDFTRTYLPERGWCYWKLDPTDPLLYIWSVSGDGHFWHDWARTIANTLHLTAICTICTRPIRPYIRLWHWTIDRTETQNGKHRFHCHTQDGKPVLITHKHTDPDGTDAYWVTEYLTDKQPRKE